MRWNDEPLKAVFTFDNDKTYEVSTHGGTNKFIVNAHKSEVEQVNYNNLFGSINSNIVNLKIFDLDNNLDINNTSSPYHGYMRNGVKIEMFISYDDVNWTPYGTFYSTGWHDKYFDGMQDVVDIVAEDELRYILNNDIPKLSAYSGIKAGELIRKVLVGCGVDSSRIKISNELDLNLRFGITEDSKVGYFLNEICQALCAVIIINDANEIMIVPALSGYSENYELSDEFIESLDTSNNTNSIYTTVKCTYDETTCTLYGNITSDEINLESGNNDINNLLFNRKSMSVAEISLECDSFDGSEIIDIKNFGSYQRGIDIDIYSNTKHEEVYLSISGKYIKSVEKSVYSDINYSDQKNNRIVSYDIYNKYVQSKEEAQKVADKMAKYIELMNHKITLKTIYSPKIGLGDILYFDTEFLSGKYKVIICDTYFGENYEKIITIIPLRTIGIWDDSKSWSDIISWKENNNLSLV